MYFYLNRLVLPVYNYSALTIARYNKSSPRAFI